MQSRCQRGVSRGLTGEEFTSELIQVVGRIQFVAAAGLRLSISSWLLAGSCLHLLELPTVPGHVGFSTVADFNAQAN